MQIPKPLVGFLIALFLIPFCSAQTISIIGGNGQLVCPSCEIGAQNYSPLTVQVNEANGEAAANTTVTWTVTQPNTSTIVQSTQTNASGQASYPLQASQGFLVFNTFSSVTVVASALGVNATFMETTASPSQISPTAAANINLVPQTAPPALVGQVGQTATTPLVISATTQLGEPLPNIQVRLTSGAANQPSVSCATEPGQAPGTVLTDKNTGLATCTPVFGNVIGTNGTYTIVVGGNYTTFGPSPLTVTAGPAGLIKVISGNNQSVNSGSLAPLSLVAEVTDVGGNPVSGATVKWAVTQGTATLSSQVNTSLGNGQVSTRVTPVLGPVQVTVSLASNSSIVAPFNVNVVFPATGIAIVSGNSQGAVENQAFADPLIVQVNDNANVVVGATVSFVVTSGSATLSAASANTNAQGQAQVTATAGPNAGPVVVTASVKSGANTLTATFNLTVNPPGPVITAIENAAGFQKGFVSPCSLAVIYGTGIASGLTGVASAVIAPQTQVDNVTVAFNAVLAPILYVANVNGQQSVAVQVPCETPVGAQQMVVTANGVPAQQAFPVNVTTYSPGIFQTTEPNGTMLPVLIRPDGSIVSLTNPAHRGETILMFVTGLGQTNPPLFTDEFDPLVLVNNSLAPQTLPVTASVVVGVDNNGVAVISATYAYDMVGVYQVAFTVPENTATGNNVPFAVAVYQGTSLVFGNPSVIPIQ